MLKLDSGTENRIKTVNHLSDKKLITFIKERGYDGIKDGLGQWMGGLFWSKDELGIDFELCYGEHI